MYEGSGQKKGSTSSVQRGVRMIFTRPRIISNSPQNTSLHTYDNVISGLVKCISREEDGNEDLMGGCKLRKRKEIEVSQFENRINR